MDSSSGSINSSSSAKTTEQGYLWKYVTRVERLGDGGGNCRWVCSFCSEEKQGSHTRLRAHLLKLPRNGISVCKKVSDASIAEMKKIEDEATKKALDGLPKRVSLPTTTMFGSSTEPSGSNLFKRKKSSDSPLGRAFDIQARDQLDAEIARMFYTGGLPFNLARNPYFVSSYTFAANHALGGYVPPGYNKLRTILLDQEKAHVERLLEPIKSTWGKKGVSIVSDGWSDPNRRPLINIMVVSESGPMFVRAVDCSGHVKDRHFIANLLKEVINEVGPEKVVQVITDNASSCKAAGEIIEGIFPHIYWTPCVVHTLNLALKNICAARNVESNQETYELCHWITDVHGDAVQIKNFIMNHSMRLAMYNRFSPLKLLSVADTRFASIVIMLKRLKLIRRAIEAMVLSEQWAQYREDDQGKARFVRDTVLSEDWWEQVNYILDFTAPIYEMIRVCDTDKPTLHLVYEMWEFMIEKVKKVIYEHEGKELSDTCAFWEVIHKILVARWTKNNTPLHCLAHSLNPK